MEDKPPIGIKPKKLWLEFRAINVQNAITRYKNHGLEPLAEWVEELKWLNDLINEE